MTNLRSCFVNAFLFSVLIVAACSSAAEDSLSPDGTPRTAPSIIGRITVMAMPVITVEENPAESYGSAKAIVGITDKTQVLRQGEGVAGNELRVGQDVKVWFDGPVMESYPVQAAAGVIVIEPNSP